MIAVAVFFGVCGLLLHAEAVSNDRGLIINGLIELSPEHATTFYWVLTFLSFGFVALAATMLTVGVLNPQQVVLADDGLYAPRRAWSRQPTFIRYADITLLERLTVNRQNFLRITYAGGMLSVVASMLESKRTFDEVHAALAERVQAARGTGFEQARA